MMLKFNINQSDQIKQTVEKTACSMVYWYMLLDWQVLTELSNPINPNLQKSIVEMHNPRKKVKVDPKSRQKPEVQQEEDKDNRNTVLVCFKNSLNLSVGTMELPATTSPKQMQEIVNKLLKQIEKEQFEEQQYTFFHKQREIKTKLSNFLLHANHLSEDKFDVIYHPVAMYKVRPITRSSASMMGHTDSVLCSQFSPDSKVLATGSGDTTVRLWDMNTQTPYREIKGTNWVMVLSWAPDGSKIAFGEKNGTIRVFRGEDEYEVTLKGHTKWIMSLCWQPLHLNQNCNILISTSKDASMRMWNTDSGTCLRAFGNHTKCVTKVIWGGENFIYSCSEDQTIKCWDFGGQFKMEFKKHAHWVNTISLSTDFVIRKGCFDNENSNIDCSKLLPKQKKERARMFYDKAVKQHRERLVTGSDDHTMMLFEPPKKDPIKILLGHQQPVNHVQFSPDGRYILSASFDKSLRLWDGYTGDALFAFKGHVAAVYQLCWSCDSRYLVSASKDSTMKLWDIKSRKLMYDLPGHADEVYTVDWSLDGAYVSSGGKDRQVKIWRN